jgi:hypothetical protein
MQNSVGGGGKDFGGASVPHNSSRVWPPSNLVFFPCSKGSFGLEAPSSDIHR